MAGIYIHIPFCRQKCYYCDFYKTVNTGLTARFIETLKKETELRKNYIEAETIETIYFGGGTPSVLSLPELELIVNFLKENFRFADDMEVTFEANPDDLEIEYLKGIKNIGINRLSIGIQSFQDEHLKRMNRRHNAKQAFEVIENAFKTGFSNISVDLIYGLPELTEKQWKESLSIVYKLPVTHLSAYHLTYHKGTPFYTWLKKGTLKELTEKQSIKQFDLLIKTSEGAGFEQYEISNFAKNKIYSKHNSSYWLGKKYLGLGPSAHSFDGNSRQWNIAHLESYIKLVGNDTVFYEFENLTENEKYNEYILTRMRTKWGVESVSIEEKFGYEKMSHFLHNVKSYIKTKNVVCENNVYTLSKKGLFISDDILASLMII